MTASIFAKVEPAPRDPILGLIEGFNHDTRPQKVNLGVGVYLAEDGRIPILKAVAEAERRRAAEPSARGYLPIEGIAAYDAATQKLLLGADSPLISQGRVITAQALGGTGGLRIGADLLRRVLPNSKVAISEPSWENHRAIFEASGFTVVSYPYYDAATQGLDFNGMLANLRTLPAQTIVVLHACCHNPTGVDLLLEQWRQVVDVVKQADLVPFLDIAYQGFGEGIEADGAAVRLFAEAGVTFLVASSFSKSFSLYGERVGALTIVDQSQDESTRVLSQLKRVIRANYSTPPTHGGMVVATVLTTPELRASWEAELGEMRARIKAMRLRLSEGLAARTMKRDFSFIERQRGMFSYTGLTADQVQRLREEFGIYAVSSGRVCVAALNTKNVDYVADAIAKVL
ncbi:MAG TPA: amino acid aminotransferase [Burkholderiaceae bacterium]|nr:amino acid aminotransferase [Burkholderiaceae bacterium]